MKKSTLAVIGACCMATGLAVAQDTPSTETRTTTRTADATNTTRSKLTNAEFVKKAGEAGTAEVALGKLGAQKATNPEVKAFAEHMVTDHSKANKELLTAAQAKGLEVPKEPGLIHKGMAEKFERQKADADFDHDFMQQMVRDHEKAVELFQAASTDQNIDPEFRALAKKTLPAVEEHLAKARTLEAKLDK